MIEPRHSKTYLEGMKYLLDSYYAFTPIGEKCPCPCRKCLNMKMWDRNMVEEHLLWNGIMENYIDWIYHDGRLSNNRDFHKDKFSFSATPFHLNYNSNDPMDELLHAAIPNLQHDENLNDLELLHDDIGEDEIFEHPEAPVNTDATNLYTSLL